MSSASKLDMNNVEFCLALKNDDIQYFKALIMDGYDVNRRILDGVGEIDDQGETTLLILAAENEAYNLITVLVGAGADLEAQDHTGAALHTAAQVDDVIAVRLLLDAGADANSKGSWGTPLHHTTCRDCQEALISYGADPKFKNTDGQTVDQLNAVRAAIGLTGATAICMDLEELKSQKQRGVIWTEIGSVPDISPPKRKM